MKTKKNKITKAQTIHTTILVRPVDNTYASPTINIQNTGNTEETGLTKMVVCIVNWSH
jgi:hypothetical protein